MSNENRTTYGPVLADGSRDVWFGGRQVGRLMPEVDKATIEAPLEPGRKAPVLYFPDRK